MNNGGIMKNLLIFFALSVVFIAAQAQNEADIAAPLLPETATSEVEVSRQSLQEKNIYISGVAGVGVYPEVSNIDKGYNVSGYIGYYLNNEIAFEAGLGLAKSPMSIKNLLLGGQRDTFDVNQYQALLAAKYSLNIFSNLNLKPTLGVVLSYTLRRYNLINGATANTGDTGGSTAFDAGAQMGLDYILSSTYVVGFDLKYMTNVSHKVNSNYLNPNYGYDGVSLESLRYFVAGVSARMNF